MLRMDAQFKRFRKVAILVSTLDRDTADTLLAQMSDEEASSVRRAILSLDEISDEDQAEVLAEFMRHGGKSTEVKPSGRKGVRGALDNGVELDIDLSSHYEDVEEVKLAPTFACLNGVDGAWLATRICQEHPQTIAVVVSHLSQVEAARLLGALPPAQQSDVIRRLADLDEMDIESLREIEDYLNVWLAENLRDRKRRTAGVSNVAAILRAADPLTRSRLVKQLRMSDEQLADQLKRTSGHGETGIHHTSATVASHLNVGEFVANTSGRDVSTAAAGAKTGIPYEQVAYANPALLQSEASHSLPETHHTERTLSTAGTGAELSVAPSFEELANWTEKSLRILLRECEPELILLALTGASENLVRRVMEMFPARQAATLKHALKHPGPTRLSDVAGAQEEIVQLALSLQQEGRLPQRIGRISVAA
jgi:flagellar motor switch protein FliG